MFPSEGREQHPITGQMWQVVNRGSVVSRSSVAVSAHDNPAKAVHSLH